MYLLEDASAPDHAKVSNTLYDIGEISGETIFIDGIKIEACANKYTFGE